MAVPDSMKQGQPWQNGSRATNPERITQLAQVQEPFAWQTSQLGGKLWLRPNINKALYCLMSIYRTENLLIVHPVLLQARSLLEGGVVGKGLEPRGFTKDSWEVSGWTLSCLIIFVYFLSLLQAQLVGKIKALLQTMGGLEQPPSAMRGKHGQVLGKLLHQLSKKSCLGNINEVLSFLIRNRDELLSCYVQSW